MGKKEKQTSSFKQGLVIGLTIVGLLTVAMVFIICTKGGRRLTSKAAASYLHGTLNYVPVTTDDGQKTVSSKEEEENPDIRKDEEVINILLLGEEAIRTTGRGRTDLMMIASINTRDQVIRLTSLLRDTYVEIPGYEPNKLNAVYAKGGIPLLYEVIQENYKIKLDGYALVGFEDFEGIIDALGGVEVTLTEEEAEYLRTHNYISNPDNRNVVAGTQLMNGNQALGYCRVRYVPNINGTKYDYGRTERQRMVLHQIFENYKNAGLTKWVQILRETLGMITTDIDEALLEEIIFAVYDNRILTMETFRVPVNGAFETPERKGNVTSPLVLDWEKNVEALHEFIYGGKDEGRGV